MFLDFTIKNIRLRINISMIKQILHTLKIASLLLFFIGFNRLFAQEILMEQDVLADTAVSNRGPNKKHFIQSTISFGLILGATDNDSTQIEMGNSFEFNTGIRYKRRFTNFYSIGAELAYSVQSYRIKQTEAKLFPSAGQYAKEKLIFNNAMVGMYNRFNFGKRGNSLGKYLDLGGYCNLTLISKHYVKVDNTGDTLALSKNTEFINRKLDYTESVRYGVMARIGSNKLSIYGKYRLSNLFKPEYGYPELSRLIIGLELGL